MITAVPLLSPAPAPAPNPPILMGALPDPIFAPPTVPIRTARPARPPDTWLERLSRLARMLNRTAPHSRALGYLFAGGLLSGLIVGSVLRITLPGDSYSFSLGPAANGKTLTVSTRPAPLDVAIAKAEAELDAALRETQN